MLGKITLRLQRFFSFDPLLLLLWLFTLLALAPLFAPGYFYGAHDGQHSVFYLIMFDASLRDGALFPRWAMHHIQGYGYPTFIIQAPLGFYLAELFVLLGAGYTLAAKLTWAAGFFFSGWGMYRLIHYWLGLDSVIKRTDGQRRAAAFVAALLYVYIPYHLLDIYVRTALNDTLLLAWFPWVFLAFDRLIMQGFNSGWYKRLALAILSLGGVLLTHTFALLSFLPLLITFVLFRVVFAAWQFRRITPLTSSTEVEASEFVRQETPLSALTDRILVSALAGIGGLLLTAAFLLPLLVEGQHLEQQVYVTDTYNYRNHFVQAGQFFSPFWGFGFSDDPAGANDGMGFQIGLIGLLLGMVAVYLLWRDNNPIRPVREGELRRQGKQWRGLTGYLSLTTVGILFVMTPAASPLWDAIPSLAIIQFPWRLLALCAFTVSALAGFTIAGLLQKTNDGSEMLSGRTGGEQHAQSAALAIGALVIFASFTYIGVDLQPVEEWREDGRAIFRFEQKHPDMIAYTEWVQEPFTTSPMTDDYAADSYVETYDVESYGEDGILDRLAIVSGEGEIVSQYSRGSSAGGVVRLDSPATVRIHLYYFPGWQVEVDGVPTAARVSDPHGLIEVDVPAGEHRIDAYMGSTPARRMGAWISWAVILVVLGLLVVPGLTNRSG